MLSDIHWIERDGGGRLAITARPRAGDWLDGEIESWAAAGVAIVLSLLDRDEISDLGLEAEPDACRAHGIEFLSHPIRDRGLPRDRETFLQLAAMLASQPKPVLIHCRAGIGRSSLAAAAIMIIGGMGAQAALERIGEARGLVVPDTDEQRRWILGLAPDQP